MEAAILVYDCRCTHVMSILLSLPTYFMSVLSIPTSVARRLEKLGWDFLCRGSRKEFKYHLVTRIQFALLFKNL